MMMAPAAMAFSRAHRIHASAPPVRVEQVMGAERQRYRLVVVLAGVVIQAVDAQRVLAEPDADELVQQDLVVRQGNPVIPDRLVKAQGDPADARRGERELRHHHARRPGLLRDQDRLARVYDRAGAVFPG